MGTTLFVLVLVVLGIVAVCIPEEGEAPPPPSVGSLEIPDGEQR